MLAPAVVPPAAIATPTGILGVVADTPEFLRRMMADSINASNRMHVDNRNAAAQAASTIAKTASASAKAAPADAKVAPAAAAAVSNAAGDAEQDEIPDSQEVQLQEDVPVVAPVFGGQAQAAAVAALPRAAAAALPRTALAVASNPLVDDLGAIRQKRLEALDAAKRALPVGVKGSDDKVAKSDDKSDEKVAAKSVANAPELAAAEGGQKRLATTRWPPTESTKPVDKASGLAATPAVSLVLPAAKTTTTSSMGEASNSGQKRASESGSGQHNAAKRQATASTPSAGVGAGIGTDEGAGDEEGDGKPPAGAIVGSACRNNGVGKRKAEQEQEQLTPVATDTPLVTDTPVVTDMPVVTDTRDVALTPEMLAACNSWCGSSRVTPRGCLRLR